MLVRAIVGQQVSVAGARTVLGRIAAAIGDPLDPLTPPVDAHSEDTSPDRNDDSAPHRASHGTDDRPRSREAGAAAADGPGTRKTAGGTTAAPSGVADGRGGGASAGDGVARLFPSAEAIAEAPPDTFPMPRARADTLRRVATEVAGGGLVIDPGADRDELRRRLLAMPGIGPWTVAYVELRALGDPDVFLATDLGVRRALERRGLPGDPRSATRLAESWRPWRSYALLHLWTGLGE